MRGWVLLGALGVAAVGSAGALVAQQPGGRPSASTRASGAESAKAAEARVEEAYGRLELRFEENRGQTDRRVRFLARGAGYSLFLTPQESVLSLSRESAPAGGEGRSSTPRGTVRRAVLRTRLLGARARPEVVGEDRLAGGSNYVRGSDSRRWLTGVPGYGRVRYSGVYPGIDLVYYGRQGRLEYDFRLAPGADVEKIRLGLRGARGLSVDRSGDLVARTAAGRVRQLAPVAYQRVGGGKRPVPARYVIERGGQVGFRLGSYDRSRPLVIDPVLVYSTYLGGATGGNSASVVAADSSGAAYLAGETSAVDFPATSGAWDRSRGGDPSDTFQSDAFVTKLSPAGDALTYSTYLGGSGGERDGALGVAVDASGRAYVTGETSSSDFPTTSGAFSDTASGGSSAFVSVLKPDGSGLAYSTLLGGSDSTTGASVAVDSFGHAYVTGSTVASDFPTKAPAGTTPFQPGPGDSTGAGDGFVAKLDPSGSGAASLVYSTYLGGDGFDRGSGIAVDAAGNAYVAGGTFSSDFATRNPLQGTLGGEQDGFVSKLNANGSALAYSTYLGGSGFENPAGIALDPAARAYVTGSTLSTDFPTASAFQPMHAGDPAVDFTNDAFVAKLDPAASGAGSLVYSSYLGGAGDDVGAAIAVAPSGSVWVAGSADTIQAPGTPGSFPRVDPLAPAAAGGDAFVSAVKPDGSGLSFSTYLGGGGEDNVGGNFYSGGLALDSAGNAYVAGNTVSTDFPTRNALQAENLGRGVGDLRETFVAKLAPVGPGVPLVTGLRERSGPAGSSVAITGRGFTGASTVRFGDTAASTFTVDSDEQITATTPARAPGPVAVTVTTAQGTSPANPAATFTYAQGTWNLTGAMRVARAEGSAATLLSDGGALVAGGVGKGLTVLSETEVYDPASGGWSTEGPMGTARQQFTATVLSDGRVLVAGGLDQSSEPLKSAELYDPVSGTWSATGAMGAARSLHTSTLLSNGKVLVAGGTDESFGPAKSAELYDPGTGSWTPAGPMTSRRTRHTATLLATGKVLAVGGNGASGSLLSAELYDPSSDRWTTTGSLAVARASHTATRLGDGRVLVAGGADGLRSLDSAQVYDPGTADFGPASAMEHRRAGPAAALLRENRVLVTGGSETGSMHTTAELYDPAANRWSSAGVMNRYRGFAFGGQRVFALPLASGKVLVGGDAQSAGEAAELYDPVAPGLPAPAPSPGGDIPPPGSDAGAPRGPLGGLLATGLDSSAPVLTAHRVSNRRFAVGRKSTPRLGNAAARAKRGTTFMYGLSEPATVTIAIAQRRSGRRRGERCVAPSRQLRKATRCTRLIGMGTLKRTSRLGANRVAFSGRIRSKPLEPSAYQATLTASDASKNRSKSAKVTFRIVEG